MATEENTKPLAEWTADQIIDRHKAIATEIKPILDKKEGDLTGADQLAKKAAADEIALLKEAFANVSTSVEVDLDELKVDDALSEEETAAAAAEAAEETDEDDDDEVDVKDLVGAAHQAHLGAPANGKGTPGTQPKVDKAGAFRQKILRASNKAAGQEDWSNIHEDYAAAVKSGNNVTVWQAGRYTDDTVQLTSEHSARQAAEIMGITGNLDLRKADNCPDAQFINDTPICLSLDDELQTWIPKFAMSDTCVVKVRAPIAPGSPTIFEWAYREADPTDSDTVKTGLVNTSTGAITQYDPDDTATWKPLTTTALACTPIEYKLRSVGYIRDIERGLDLCDAAELERQIGQDSAYLAQSKSASIIAAMNAQATASSNAHTFDAVGGITDTAFANASSALAWLMAEVLPVKAKENGVDMSNATLIAPRSIAALMAVARYESLVDNTLMTMEALGEAAGVGSVLTTDGISVTGGVGSPVPTAVLSTVGRTRTFDIYVAQRSGWRQGQGPGVRGGVERDERNLRGNKRMAIVEDDLVNIPVGCLPVVRFTVTVCFVGGHAAGATVACSPTAEEEG